MKKFLAVCFLSLICFTVFGHAVTNYQLANGLQLRVEVDQRAPLAAVEVWYKIGSSYESDGITGISHVLEHMMFRGTKHYPNDQYAKQIAAAGGRYNAATDRDYTVYYTLIPIQALPLVFALEADRMHNLNLNLADFTTERQVVMEERHSRVDDNPYGMAYERLMAQAYIFSPYRHMPIGWTGDLKNLTLEDVRDWYKKWYAPNNVILVVVGDVEPAAVYQLAQQYFDHLPHQKLPLIKPQTDMPSLGLRTAFVKLPAGSDWLIMGYHVPSVVSYPTNNDAYVLAVIAQILSGGNNNWLHTVLVDQQKIAHDVSVNYNPFTRLSSLFKISGTPAAGHSVEQLRAAIIAQLQRLQNKPIDPKLLTKVKTGVIATYVYGQDSLLKQASIIGSLEVVGLSWQLRDSYVTKISSVTPTDIQTVARRYFSEDNLTQIQLQALPTNTIQQQHVTTVPSGDDSAR